MRVGCSTTANFGHFIANFLGIFRDKASNIILRYAVSCRPVIDCKMNDLVCAAKIRSRQAVCCSKDASFGAHCTDLNEDRPIQPATKV